MQHVDPHLVFCLYIRPILDQQLDKLHIAMETCIVQGIEPLISLRRSVEPICDLFLYMLVYLILLMLRYLLSRFYVL